MFSLSIGCKEAERYCFIFHFWFSISSLLEMCLIGCTLFVIYLILSSVRFALANQSVLIFGVCSHYVHVQIKYIEFETNIALY
jgi:hypothetical protein